MTERLTSYHILSKLYFIHLGVGKYEISEALPGLLVHLTLEQLRFLGAQTLHSQKSAYNIELASDHPWILYFMCLLYCLSADLCSSSTGQLYIFGQHREVCPCLGKPCVSCSTSELMLVMNASLEQLLEDTWKK